MRVFVGCSFLAYNWKLPAYSGAFYIQLNFLAFYLQLELLHHTISAFSVTIGAFLLTSGQYV